MKQITHSESRRLIERAVALKHDLMEAGFMRTYHKMDEVTKEIGWEMVDIIEGKHPVKLVEEE